MRILVNRTALDRAIANAAAGGLMREEERRAMFARLGRGGGGGGGGGTASGGRARSTIRQDTATGATTKVVVPKPGNPQEKADALYYWRGRLPPYYNYPPEMYRPLPVYPGLPTYPEKPFPIRPGYPEKPISKNPPKVAPKPPQRIILPIVGPYPRYPLNPERPVYYATASTATKKPTYTTKDYTGTSVAKVIKVYEDARKNPNTSGRVLAVRPKK